ncbi:NirD/YgiW/YdeI family stress tolerance protein [Paenalcaligenes niemegkensis]|uniref:YgiW/YdeI family stress tolerance OB fold protein n=1 Tax=Paenalcaligenes niemegkensis TaxID=2895469 RepID=UPI001EE7E5D1|nr:NirD/YgiW/YdeI family stress tolerance protein [Paenalcaligenes niemegkensis]MCQ9616691.1 NirD/YgiW/YdeI family stress tolerance protein [Paenalcaligenes niemegkensis]
MSKTLKLRYVLASVVVTSIFSLPVHAQYSGPSAIGGSSVAAILENPVDDQDVRLEGNLLRRTGHDKYVFSDGTGEIIAEIKDKHFAGQKVDEKMKVELIGEVDTSRIHPPEIEVESLRVIK